MLACCITILAAPAPTHATSASADTRLSAAGLNSQSFLPYGAVSPVGILRNGAIRVTASAECWDITGGESTLTATVVQVDGPGRPTRGSATVYADCAPAWDGGHEGQATLRVRPEGGGEFHTGTAFVVVHDSEGVRLGADWGTFPAEVKWAELDVRLPASTSTPGATEPEQGRELGSGTTPPTRDTGSPTVNLEGVTATRVSDGAGVVIRVSASCSPLSHDWHEQTVTVDVAQRPTSQRATTGGETGPAYDSLACSEDAPGWIDVPVIPDGRAFQPGRLDVHTVFRATYDGWPEQVTVEDALNTKEVLRATGHASMGSRHSARVALR